MAKQSAKAQTSEKAEAPKKAKTTKGDKPKDWRKSQEFQTVKSWIESSVPAGDPLIRDKIDEYMAFWVQRKLLAADVEKRGVLVMDDRGRLMENRNVSLGVQVSKQMQVLLQQLGLFTRRPKTKAAEASQEDPGEDDDL